MAVSSGENVTLAESLRTVGYATGLFGKWHIGQDKKTGPSAQGFDVVADVFEREKSSGAAPDPKDVGLATTHACEFITAHKAKPFFASVAYHAIHPPIEGKAETIAHFKAKPPGRQHHDALDAACITDMDAAGGRLLQHLVELYNLRNDIGEHHDLAASESAKRDELLDDVLRWIEQTHAPLASQPNPTYDPAKPVVMKRKKAVTD